MSKFLTVSKGYRHLLCACKCFYVVLYTTQLLSKYKKWTETRIDILFYTLHMYVKHFE